MTSFIYESICAGALGGDPPPSLLAEGRAMLHAAATDFAKVGDVVALSHEPIANVRCIPPADEDRQFNQLAAECDRVLVIAPEFDGILADRSERVHPAKLLGSLPSAVRLTADKLALADHWFSRGVPTPLTRPATEKPSEYPVILKPRDGAGSQGVRLVNRPEDWTADGKTLEQEYAVGRACSVAFLVGPGTIALLRAGEQMLSADFAYRGGRMPLSREEERRAIALGLAALEGIDGLAGFVGVDMVLGERDVAIEINPRLTTSYIGLRELCRNNLAAAWLDVLAGETPRLSWHDGEATFLADGRIVR